MYKVKFHDGVIWKAEDKKSYDILKELQLKERRAIETIHEEMEGILRRTFVERGVPMKVLSDAIAEALTYRQISELASELEGYLQSKKYSQ